jgi:hypothetical protein
VVKLRSDAWVNDTSEYRCEKRLKVVSFLSRFCRQEAGRRPGWRGWRLRVTAFVNLCLHCGRGGRSVRRGRDVGGEGVRFRSCVVGD